MDKLDKIFEEYLEDTYVDNDYGGNELVSVIYERDLKDIKEQLLLHNVSQQRELLRFMEYLSNYWGIDEVIDCTKHLQVIEQYKP